mmetsp:Transcript_23454/g.42099  ORF Transcript_23454/g.42099 Transcript_23454/m.42099 type:complete len:210 (+) Transcript_23454:232-861(+)
MSLRWQLSKYFSPPCHYQETELFSSCHTKTLTKAGVTQIFSQNSLHKKCEVQQEHEPTQCPCHFPPLAMYNCYYSEQHSDQDKYRLPNSVGLYQYYVRCCRPKRENQPRKWQPHENIKNVTTNGAGYSHVSLAHPCYNHTREQVRNRCPCCQNCVPHYHGRDTNGISQNFYPINHGEREKSNPHNRKCERSIAILSKTRPSHVRNSEGQ